MRVKPLTAAERHRNGEGWYCCNCGELIGRLADEIERLRDQHDTYVEMLEQLTQQLDAAAVLLRHPDRVEWGYDAEENALAYFLDGKFAGPTIRHAIRMAAKRQEVEDE